MFWVSDSATVLFPRTYIFRKGQRENSSGLAKQPYGPILKRWHPLGFGTDPQVRSQSRHNRPFTAGFQAHLE